MNVIIHKTLHVLVFLSILINKKAIGVGLNREAGGLFYCCGSGLGGYYKGVGWAK